MSLGPWMPNPNFDKDFTNPDGPLFSIEAFRGFRGWYMDNPLIEDGTPNSGALRSITYDYHWTTGVNQSKCLARRLKVDHASHSGGHKPDCYDECEYPSTKCKCGFYAYFEEDYFNTAQGNHILVHGVIDAYGRVVKGKKGFRAQTGVIVGLIVPMTEKIPDTIARKYATDAESVQQIIRESLATTYPGVPQFDDINSLLTEMPPTKI